ncbi:MAG: hypothetical protein Kapaf2KO_00470 [Candidatus Kapaibacteriales bacterium]
MVKFYKALVSAFILLSILSCGDDSTGPSSTFSGEASRYEPLAVGNEWYYERTEIDEDGNPVSNEVFYDTVRVVEQAEYNGFTAIRLETTSSDGDSFSEWIRQDGNDTYSYLEAPEAEGLPIDTGIFPTGWQKTNSLDNETVLIADEDFDNELNIGPIESINGNFQLKLKTSDAGTFSGQNFSGKAREAVLTNDFDVIATINFGFPLAIPVQGVITETSYHVEGVGIVEKTIISEVDDDNAPTSGFFDSDMLGFQPDSKSILVGYKLN